MNALMMNTLESVITVFIQNKAKGDAEFDQHYQ